MYVANWQNRVMPIMVGWKNVYGGSDTIVPVRLIATRAEYSRASIVVDAMMGGLDVDMNHIYALPEHFLVCPLCGQNGMQVEEDMAQMEDEPNEEFAFCNVCSVSFFPSEGVNA